MNDGADGCLVVSMAFMNNDMIDDCWWELSHDLRSKKKKVGCAVHVMPYIFGGYVLGDRAMQSEADRYGIRDYSVVL